MTLHGLHAMFCHAYLVVDISTLLLIVVTLLTVNSVNIVLQLEQVQGRYVRNGCLKIEHLFFKFIFVSFVRRYT